MKTLSHFALGLALSVNLTVQLATGAVPLTDKKGLTLEAAKQVAAAAEKAAISHKWNMVIAIMDDGGNLLYLARMDDAPIGSVEVAQEKARTSVIFKSPTKAFEDGLSKGTTSLLKLQILPFAGGVPLMANGKIIGAVGVSGGAASSDDATVAQAAADWLANNLK